MANLLLASLFGALGIAVLAFVFRAVLSAFVGPDLRGLPARWRLKRKMRALAAVDKALERGALADASQLLKDAFYLEQVKLDKKFIAYVHHHNVSVLGRLVVLHEKRGVHMQNLALVEGLFQSRRELMESHYDTISTRSALREKRGQKGKDVPQWSSSEFDSKLEGVRDKIFTNKRTLRAQLQEAFKALGSLSSEREITYH